MTPVRITLSRRKGFNLQEASRALNGLSAVKVDRTTKYGNPFAYEDKAACVECFQSALPELMHFQMGDLEDLRGKNLACWCKAGEPCHAEVLLRVANR